MWEFQAPNNSIVQLTIFYLEIEQGVDYIYIGEGDQGFDKESQYWKKLTGTLTNQWIWKSYTSSIVIIFASDGKGAAKGFWFECVSRKYIANIISNDSIGIAIRK